MRKHQWMERIGEGFSGQVYHAYNEVEGRECAIKIQKEFQREEVAISLVVNQFDGFIKTWDYWMARGKEGGGGGGENVACLEMELAEGSLRELLYREDFSIEERVVFYFEIIFALNEAHKKIGFFHADLRVDNILFFSQQESRTYLLGEYKLVIETKKRPVLADFGRSFLIDGEKLQLDDLAGLYTLQSHLFPPHISEKIGDPRDMANSLNYKLFLLNLICIMTTEQ